MVLIVDVTGLAGTLCRLTMGAEAVVEELKTALVAELGLPAGEQRLFCGVEELRPGTFLCSLATAAGEEEEERVLELQLIRRPPEHLTWMRQLATTSGRGTREVLRGLPAGAREDREVVLAAVAADGLALEQVAAELQADRDVVLAAVSQNGCALKHAVAALRADREVVLVAAAQSGFAFRRADEALRADREVVLAAVKAQGCALEGASEELRADREVVLAATSQSGHAFRYAAAELQADRAVVLAAVARQGSALRHAVTELRADREVQALAIAAGSRGDGPHLPAVQAPPAKNDCALL